MPTALGICLDAMIPMWMAKSSCRDPGVLQLSVPRSSATPYANLGLLRLSSVWAFIRQSDGGSDDFNPQYR